MNHDPLCPGSQCSCEPDDYGHMPTCIALYCLCDLIATAHRRGYEEAKKFYTNDCFYCGYAGEWSTYVCDECEKLMSY